MRIGTNIPALNTALTLKSTNRLVSDAMLKLSTGKRINSAKDDAAGLAIANKLGLQVTGLNRASQNSMDGISLIQTTDGSLDVVVNMLQRLRELSVQAANGVLGVDDMSKIQMEIGQVVQEINENSFKTEYNKIKTLNGEASVVTGFETPVDGSDIASILYVSDNVPPGTLALTVDKAGTPPVVIIDTSTVIGTDADITINGATVSISATDDMNAVKEKLASLANQASLDIRYDSSDTAYLAGENAGSRHEVSASINSAGKSANLTVTPGTDAVLSGFEYRDPNGVAMDEFNLSAGYIADGNEIVFKSRNQQSIALRLKTIFTPGSAAGDFVYDDKTGQISSQSALNFEAVVHDYGQLMLQIGPNFNEGLGISIPRINAETLGLAEYKAGELNVLIDVSTQAGATNAITMLDNALYQTLETRSKLGAYQNRLEQTIINLDQASINTETSRSRLQDTDMAEAMTQFTSLNVKYQAGIAILAQANQRPQQILSLLQ
ncbi:MAG: hypothetical protein LBC41_14945 [Clostridiales bacterium]|jgi:flagellin|nr:hypothetical protein [Clostridiales bacterium]